MLAGIIIFKVHYVRGTSSCIMSRPGQKWHLRYFTSFQTSGSTNTQWFLKERGKKEFINPIKLQQGPTKMKRKSFKLWWTTFWGLQNTQMQNNSSHRRRKGRILRNANQQLTLLLPYPITTTKLFGFHVQSKRKPAKNPIVHSFSGLLSRLSPDT